MPAHNGHGDVAVFENQPVTAAKFINKSLLFILLLNVIRRLVLKPISEQKDEDLFVSQHSSSSCCVQPWSAKDKAPLYFGALL